MKSSLASALVLVMAISLTVAHTRSARPKTIVFRLPPTTGLPSSWPGVPSNVQYLGVRQLGRGPPLHLAGPRPQWSTSPSRALRYGWFGHVYKPSSCQ